MPINMNIPPKPIIPIIPKHKKPVIVAKTITTTKSTPKTISKTISKTNISTKTPLKTEKIKKHNPYRIQLKIVHIDSFDQYLHNTKNKTTKDDYILYSEKHRHINALKFHEYFQNDGWYHDLIYPLLLSSNTQQVLNEYNYIKKQEIQYIAQKYDKNQVYKKKYGLIIMGLCRFHTKEDILPLFSSINGFQYLFLSPARAYNHYRRIGWVFYTTKEQQQQALDQLQSKTVIYYLKDEKESPYTTKLYLEELTADKIVSLASSSLSSLSTSTDTVATDTADTVATTADYYY